jgi:hypothetical protein
MVPKFMGGALHPAGAAFGFIANARHGNRAFLMLEM